MIKFRCSNHKLPIEVGRRQGLERGERLCTKCQLRGVGDEFHLIFDCPAFDLERRRYIPRHFRKVKSMFSLCKLLETKSKKVQLNLAKFLRATETV